ncbi:aminotransferase class IV [Roseibacillus ishigakijimensis]|uniref:branched-chain-amino-acid transaminase n=1 Tax=Roseibacillus ishigakijimensis TaxID=454146 RepID=A0A934RNV8_9BACT|nr:aminotransferase class IV [Roseibacillus ishigakijimensis]MBK1833097.1 aminotransferase class IV [Roseibacillus ishigakijimensis]
MMVWLNGDWKAEERALIDSRDRGFLRGEGVFETMLALGGRVFAWEEHWLRLEKGVRAFGLSLPSPAKGREIAEELLVRNGYQDSLARVRLRVTRTPDSLLFTAEEAGLKPAVLTAWTSRYRRNEHGALAGLKALSYGENSLALAEAKSSGGDEALLANLAGHWCEGTWSNVFVVEGHTVLTPPLSSGCLPGVTRARVLALARRAELAVREEERPIAFLQDSSEIFLTSSLLGVRPLGALDGRPLAVGAVTLQLGQLLAEQELAETS